jgi:flagellar assembly protein FliH
VEKKKLSSKIIRGDKQLNNVKFGKIPDGVVVGGSARRHDDTNEVETDPVQIALTKASSIIREAEEKALLIENEARRQGYEKGLELARAENIESVNVLKNVADVVVEKKWKLINDIEDNIVSLAVEIAEKVIGEQIKVSPDVVLSIIKKALMMAAERENLVLRINPEDLEVVKTNKDNIMSSMDGIQKIEIVADRRIGRGGLVLETRVGNVDARIQSQLDQAEQSLRGVVGHE